MVIDDVLAYWVRRAAAAGLPLRWIKGVLELKYNRLPPFMFNGRPLHHFFHTYNNFGLTERTIEIPIVQSYLRACPYRNILEIGNVTSHYYDEFRALMSRKTVVDKYEQGYDVIREDIAKYHPSDKFDFVFSISTFEHMDSDLGRNPDYRPGASKNITVAVDNIQHVYENILDAGGKFVLTAIMGYTPEWDLTIKSGVLTRLGFRSVKVFMLRRMSSCTWVQVDGDCSTNPSPFDQVQPKFSIAVVEIDK